MPFLADFIKKALGFAALFFLSAVLVSFSFPIVFDTLESVTQKPLPFEGALRLSILGIHALMLMTSGMWILRKGTRMHLFVWSAFFISFLLLGGIFVFDRTHRLLEEFSWIRYTTSLFLILAAIWGAALWVRLKKAHLTLKVQIFCFLVAGAFLYAGFDEIFEIHEAIGRWLRARYTLPEATGDFVTLGYALVTLLALVSFVRREHLAFLKTYRMSAYLFLSGACVYAVSTLLDTVDVVILAKLRISANIFSELSHGVISDAWYTVWSVKNSLNGFEEVFEHSAALLFFLGIYSLVHVHSRLMLGEQIRFWYARRFAWIVGGVSGVVLVALVVLSAPATFPTSPLVDSRVYVTRIGGYFDGFFHTDDLDFHPFRGLVIANEGRSSLYSFFKEHLFHIPDPDRLIRDPDSVAVTERGIYVSDGNAGQVVLFDEKGKGEVIISKKDGLVHPEGIEVVGDTITILDESEHAIFRYGKEKKLERWKPDHPDWKTPEGIAYDQSTKTFIVTDDTTGAVFRLVYGKSIEKITTLEKPEDVDVLPNGSLLITDNAWGAVFHISKDGVQKKVLQFRRMYRDVQGIAVDEHGSMFVVTADGFDSTSFMPSQLFRIDGVPL